MAPPSKIVDASEVERWLEEGRTYQWMVEEYERKYNLEVTKAMFSNFRAKRGLPRRTARDDKLIPWEIKPEHRWGQPIWALRTEARLRAGMETAASQVERLQAFKDRLFSDGLVIHYDAKTEQGWWLIPRREGVDTDMIREPEHPTRKRLTRE